MEDAGCEELQVIDLQHNGETAGCSSEITNNDSLKYRDVPIAECIIRSVCRKVRGKVRDLKRFIQEKRNNFESFKQIPTDFE